MSNTTYTETQIVADEKVPAIHLYRDFAATPEQLFRAHTDPEIYKRWIGPSNLSTEIDYWDARNGGSWRFLNVRGEETFAFRGCFHEVSPERIVQTFTWEGMPESVSLETVTFEDLGDGRTRLHAFSLTDSFEGRDQWLGSGMESGINEGYGALDALLADGAV